MNKIEFQYKWDDVSNRDNPQYTITFLNGTEIYPDDYKFIDKRLVLYLSNTVICRTNVENVVRVY